MSSGIRKRSKKFQHRGKRYTASIVQRPFREGLEIFCQVGDITIHVAELGLGEQALIEKLKAEIDRCTPGAISG